MDILRAMALLVDQPWLALIAAMLFVLLFAISKSKLSLTVGALWLAYALYEYGMKIRLLCSGECNIRVDLLGLYPLLVASSGLGFVSFLLALRRRSRA
jgi:hypothetical protein